MYDNCSPEFIQRDLDDKLFQALRGRNHADLKKALADGANPDALNKDGIPAIFAVDPADTISLIALIESGANVNVEQSGRDPVTKKSRPPFTLVEKIANDLSEVTPMLRSQLHRIQLLLSVGATPGPVEGDATTLEAMLVSFSGALTNHGLGTEGDQKKQYDEAYDEVERVEKLVHRIGKHGDKARPNPKDFGINMAKREAALAAREEAATPDNDVEEVGHRGKVAKMSAKKR